MRGDSKLKNDWPASRHPGRAAEPTIRQIEVDLLAEAPLRSDAEGVADQGHPDHQLGINRGPTDAAVEGHQVPPDFFKLEKSVDRPKQMVGWDVLFKRELIEQRSLFDAALSAPSHLNLKFAA
jgi:hypothetical protein